VNTLGEYLQRERELRHISLDEVVESTKISRRYLEAIEEGRYESLPGEAFVRGFIRSYVKYIGLDPRETMLMYDQGRLQPDISSVPPDRTTPTKRSSNARLLLWVLAVGFVLVGGVLFRIVSSLEGTSAFLPKLSTRADETPPQTLAAPLVLTAIAESDTWLRVAVDGKEPHDILLRAGQSTKWRGSERFVVSIGNVRATRLQLNGREHVIPLPQQNMLRDYILSREMLN
jgi:transcriptional regulator with XRE-family HTH domain